MQWFEWDEVKNESNKRKHGVSFGLAARVFDDPNFVAYVERVVDSEDRWHAIGVVTTRIILTVVHTYRDEATDEIIRIISARLATAQERKLYVESLG